MKAIHFACKYGNASEVIELIESGQAGDLNHLSEIGYAPIHFAAQGGHSDVIQVLAGAGVDVGTPNFNGLSPLHLAVQSRNVSAVEALLALGAISSALAPHSGMMPVHLAAEGGHKDMIRALLRGTSCVDINCLSNRGVAPLHLSASNGHTLAVEVLLSLGADMNIESRYLDTPLMYATMNDHAPVIELLHRAGANIDKMNDGGFTALHFASARAHVRSMTTLLRLGARIDIPALYSGCSALQLARALKHEEVLRVLERVVMMQKLARTGRVSELRGVVILELKDDIDNHVPVVQWLPLLSPCARAEMQSWANGLIRDAAGCFAALFGHRATVDLIRGPEATVSLMTVRDVAHDGLHHLRSIIKSYLVYPRASATTRLKELARLGIAVCERCVSPR